MRSIYKQTVPKKGFVTHEVIAIGGTDRGADTAIVIKPAYARKFKDLQIREILAKPRSGG